MTILDRSPATNRVWFSDPRTPLRRMSLTTHPAESMVVVSLWQGRTCTGTFRLPLAESARLIATLADGMAASLVEPVDSESDGGRGPWSRLAGWIRSRFPGPPSGPPTHLRILG